MKTPRCIKTCLLLVALILTSVSITGCQVTEPNPFASDEPECLSYSNNTDFVGDKASTGSAVMLKESVTLLQHEPVDCGDRSRVEITVDVVSGDADGSFKVEFVSDSDAYTTDRLEKVNGVWKVTIPRDALEKGVAYDIRATDVDGNFTFSTWSEAGEVVVRHNFHE